MMRLLTYVFRAALIKKWAEYRYYRWDFAVGLVIKLIFFLAMIFAIPAESGQDAAIRVTGFVLWYFGAHLIAKMANLLVEEAYLGALPQVLAARSSIWLFLGVTALAELLLSSIWIAAFVVVALVLSPLPTTAFTQGLFSWNNLVAASAALLGLAGMALTIFGLSIHFKRAGSFAEVLIFFMLFFSGFFVPMEEVPAVILLLSSVSPLYWFVKAIGAFLPGAWVWPPMAALLVCGAGWLAAGAALTRVLLYRATVDGTLTRY